MEPLLQRQYKYYLNHEDEIKEHYSGQFIVIVDEKIIDSFGSQKDAYIYCVQHYRIGEFFIQEVN